MRFLFSIIPMLFLPCFALADTATSTAAAPINTGISTFTSGNSAQISWHTDIPGDSSVYFGTNSSSQTQMSNTRCDAGGYVTNHCVVLSGLAYSTTYYFQVVSTSQLGLIGQLGGFSFLSAGAPSSSPSPSPSPTPSPTPTPSPSPSGTNLPPAVMGFSPQSLSDGRLQASVGFTKTMDQSSLTPSSAYFVDSTGQQLVGTLTYYSTGVSVTTISPAVYGTMNVLIVKGSVKDSTALSLGTDYMSPQFSGGSTGASTSTTFTSTPTTPTYPTTSTTTTQSSTSTTISNNVSTLPPGNLYVKAVDDFGMPLQGVDVSVQGPLASGGSYTVDKYTGGDGYINFQVSPGSIIVRGFFDPDHYLNPPQQSISFASSSFVTLVFTKQQATTAQNTSGLGITGTTKIADGSSVPNAYVYAYSNQGEFRNTYSDVSGHFSLILSANSTWHLGAGKEGSGIAWKADEMIVSASSASVILLLKQLTISTQSAQTVSSPTQQISVQTASGAGVVIPPSSATMQSTGAYQQVSVNVKPTVEAPPAPDAKLIGVAVDITMKDSGGNAITSFTQKVEIDLPYTDADLTAAGTSVENIKPAYFNEKTGSWITISDFTIDKARHLVVAHVDHLTRFAIVSPADITPPPSPTSLIAAAVGANIWLSWKNPTSDFDHAKIYRSTQRGALGTVLVSNVAAALFTDKSTQKGSIFYYTVRSVDPAGNESQNTDQTVVSGVGAGVSIGKLTKLLQIGSTGVEVTTLQNFLITQGYLKAAATGYFGQLTKKAVILFQEANKNDVLLPATLSHGTGVVGALSRAKINQLLAP
jgi:hypothetical protein